MTGVLLAYPVHLRKAFAVFSVLLRAWPVIYRQLTFVKRLQCQPFAELKDLFLFLLILIIDLPLDIITKIYQFIDLIIPELPDKLFPFFPGRIFILELKDILIFLQPAFMDRNNSQRLSCLSLKFHFFPFIDNLHNLQIAFFPCELVRIFSFLSASPMARLKAESLRPDFCNRFATTEEFQPVICSEPIIIIPGFYNKSQIADQGCRSAGWLGKDRTA